MRKTLLIAAAAFAASVIYSQAGVYSQNIVGYVNVPVPVGGYVNLANPLDAAGASGVNNAITNLIPVFSGNYDGDLLVLWNGSGFNSYTLDSGQPTGVGNASDTAPVAPPILNPGTGFFIQNTAGTVTNTYVGTVHVDAAATGSQVVGQTTNNIPVGTVFISSVLPVGGGLGSVDQFPTNGTFDGSLVEVPNIVGGQVKGYTVTTVDSGQSTGWGNASDTAAVSEPIIPVGSGFLFQNTSGAAAWVQAL